MSAAPVRMGTLIRDCGATCADYGAEFVSGVVGGVKAIKDNRGSLHDTVDFSVHILQAGGHLFGPAGEGFSAIARGVVGILDLAEVVVDVPDLVDRTTESVREGKSKLKVLEKAAFVAAGVLGVIMWLGARGFEIPRTIISKIGATFSVFGKPLTITAASVVNGLVAVGFVCLGVNTYRDLQRTLNDTSLSKHTKDVRVVHRVLIIARCVAQVAACVLFVVAVGVSALATAAPFILALGAIALGLAVLEFLYSRGHEQRLKEARAV